LFSRETRTSGHFNANFRNDKNVDRLEAASSDFDIFNLFDTDDIELSQLCEKMDTENNLINTADIFDIFNLLDTDDIELSQLCEKMDTENNLINTADIFDILICLIQMTLNCRVLLN
jgi:hypothetical protein